MAHTSKRSLGRLPKYLLNILLALGRAWHVESEWSGERGKKYIKIIDSQFVLYLIDLNEVRNIVLGLKNRKCAGIDEIPWKVLKVGVEYLLRPLSHLINLIFETDVVSKSIKDNITPLHKEGDVEDRSKYRPISHI